MSKKVLIVGGGNACLQAAKILAEQGNTCILHSVVDSQFTEPKEETVFGFKAPPVFEETFADLKEPVFNQQKHDKTCAKNRKKRKKRKRR